MISLNKPARRVLLLTAVSFILSLVIFLSGMLNSFELKAYDLLSRKLNPLKAAGEIIIVQVDQQSIDALSREGITWPWPRQMYAPLVEYLSGADAVFLDILFTEPSSYGYQDDAIFSEALKKASNVYLPVFLSGKKKDTDKEDIEFIKRIAVKERIFAAQSFGSAVTPVNILKSSISGAGNVTIPPDEDGIYRKVPLLSQSGDYIIPHFVLSYLMQKGTVIIKGGVLYSKNTRVPSLNGNLMLRFYRDERPFPTLSAVEILKAYIDNNSSREPSIKKAYFRGKKVFIGLTAAGLYDLKPTAVSSISTGVIIHATTLDNIINKNFIRPLSVTLVIFLMLLLSFFINYSVLKYHSLPANLAVFLGSLVISLSIPVILFRNTFYMNIIPLPTSLMVSFLIAVAYSYAAEGKERRFVRKVFSQYMDEKIVEYILKNPSLIRPGGQKRYVTVFFADIAGFTSFAEKASPKETARVLHKILNAFTEIIIQNRGVVDKYIGDCVMAFWGAPIDTGEDEILACTSALQCIQALQEINKDFASEGLPRIHVRIGIHSGDVIVGNLGSDRLFDYTVIGDTVNLASRLESANKLFHTMIIISEETLKKTDNVFFTRELGTIEVKGKEKTVTTFELIGEDRQVGHNKRASMNLFHKGMALFREGIWRDALDVFNSVLSEMPGDGPSEFYRERCEELIKNPLLTGSCNIIKLLEK